MGNAQSPEASALQEARQKAVFDDQERAALLFLTSKDQAAPDIPAAVETLTNCGCRSGVQLSSRPGHVHLSTRNFCSRLLKNQNPTCLLFLLDGLINQLRVVNGDTPSVHTTGGQRAVFIQRTCNTIVVVRVLLTELIVNHQHHIDARTTPPSSSTNSIAATPTAAAAATATTTSLLDRMVPTKDREQLLLGLLQFCRSYSSRKSPNSSFTAADGTFSTQQMDYDVHLNVINLLLVLMSTRLLSYNDSSSSAHPFRATLFALTESHPALSTTVVQCLLSCYMERERVPSASTYHKAMEEMRQSVGPRYASMTTPPMPPGYRTHDPVAKSFQHTVEQHSQDDSGSFTVTNVVMGLVDGLSTSLYNAASASVLDPLSSVANMVGIAGIVAAEKTDVLVSQYPIADRAMLLLSVLVHDYHHTPEKMGGEEGEGERKESTITENQDEAKSWTTLVFRRALSNILDKDEEEDRRVFARGSTTSRDTTTPSALATTQGIESVESVENGGSPALDVCLSFSSLYASIVKALNNSFSTPSIVGTREAINTHDSAQQHHLFTRLRQRVVFVDSSILLYTLMTTSLAFREYVLSRNDLENIILPLLRSLHEHHRSAPMPPSHLYVVLILLLMFSQVGTSKATSFLFCLVVFTRFLIRWRVGFAHFFFSFNSCRMLPTPVVPLHAWIDWTAARWNGFMGTKTVVVTVAVAVAVAVAVVVQKIHRCAGRWGMYKL